MNRTELLKHLATEVYCRIRPSGERGVGVFAVRDIGEGVDPFPGAWHGEYVEVSPEDLKTLPAGVQKMVRDYCIFQEPVWLVPEVGFNRLDISFFINHSNTPNVATDDGERFYALRNIAEGEELLVNYNTYSGEHW